MELSEPFGGGLIEGGDTAVELVLQVGGIGGLCGGADGEEDGDEKEA